MSWQSGWAGSFLSQCERKHPGHLALQSFGQRVPRLFRRILTPELSTSRRLSTSSVTLARIGCRSKPPAAVLSFQNAITKDQGTPVTTHRRRLVAVCLFDSSRAATVAVSAKSRAPRRRAIALSVVSLLLILSGTGCGGVFNTGKLTSPTIIPLFPQTQLDGNCFPKFAVSLPVFGPAGSIPRVDAASHHNLTVTMTEINQQVLPPGSFAACGGSDVRLGPTRVWAFQTTDTNTGAMLGPAHWPAVTIVAQRGTATQVEYVNQLPSFNQSNPSGPGLVQGVLPFDQSIHWADPLQSHCGMQKPAGSQSV